MTITILLTLDIPSSRQYLLPNEVYQFQDIPSSRRLSPNEVYLPNKERSSSGEATVQFILFLFNKNFMGKRGDEISSNKMFIQTSSEAKEIFI